MKAVFVIFAIVLAYVACAYVPVNCPPKPDPGKDYALVPHPCNCSTYYVCQGPTGPKTPMPCPRPLQWNNVKKQCDYPQSAHCVLDPNCNK